MFPKLSSLRFSVSVLKAFLSLSVKQQHLEILLKKRLCSSILMLKARMKEAICAPRDCRLDKWTCEMLM